VAGETVQLADPIPRVESAQGFGYPVPYVEHYGPPTLGSRCQRHRRNLPIQGSDKAVMPRRFGHDAKGHTLRNRVPGTGGQTETSAP
jgi:hypothetical protein